MSNEHAVASATIRLMQGVVYRESDEDTWGTANPQGLRRRPNLVGLRGQAAGVRRAVQSAVVRGSVKEVLAMERRRVVKKDLVKRAAARSTKASAKLENREVPAGFVRSSSVKWFLAVRQTRS